MLAKCELSKRILAVEVASYEKSKVGGALCT